MDQDRGLPGAQGLHVDEIAQRELEPVHAVDETELDRPAEQAWHVVLREKIITRFGMDRGVGGSGNCTSGAGSTPMARVCGPTRMIEWPSDTPISR